jgi:hypothetical protein
MSWAPEESFSFVVYYKQGVSTKAQGEVARWTRSMIDLALRHEGRYYLPYQLHATQKQFEAAYPQHSAFKQLRNNAGARRLNNSLWDKYKV